jgi:hypothetical protein
VDAEAGHHPEFLPQLRLDELLAELQGRLQAVLATRDRMRGLLEAVVGISSGLDLESTLRRIVETAVRLVEGNPHRMSAAAACVTSPTGRRNWAVSCCWDRQIPTPPGREPGWSGGSR